MPAYANQRHGSEADMLTTDAPYARPRPLLS